MNEVDIMLLGDVKHQCMLCPENDASCLWVWFPDKAESSDKAVVICKNCFSKMQAQQTFSIR
jgi:hypothetical protein